MYFRTKTGSTYSLDAGPECWEVIRIGGPESGVMPLYAPRRLDPDWCPAVKRGVRCMLGLDDGTVLRTSAVTEIFNDE